MAPSNVAERMALYGTDRLSDAELLTELAGRGLPKGWPSLEELSKASLGELLARGWPRTMATRLVLAFELGRRAAHKPPARGARCLSPEQVYELLRPLAAEPVEEFWVVLLDVRGRLLKTERIARGSVSQCPVAPRDVMRPAVREGAHGIVFVHNHPSGDPAPSPEDGDLTERLRVAAELVGVLPRDHVIVAADGFYSFVGAGRWRR